MNCNETERLEIELVLHAVHKKYGYDFRSYSKASVSRRIRQFATNKNYDSISAIIPELLRNELFLSEFIQYLSIPVTEMFRDPFVFNSFRRNVVPVLKTYPHIKIWIAGCATGEEIYSIAILAEEEGILNKTTIYGTDFNDSSLEKAKNGIYNLDRMRSFTRNYIESGGIREFSHYYRTDNKFAIFNSSLRKRITLSNHNLVSDGIFGEMHFIICRNVLIYFERELQNRVLYLFTNSLIRNCFLCLGTKETINFSPVKDSYSIIDNKARIFKKKIL